MSKKRKANTEPEFSPIKETPLPPKQGRGRPKSPMWDKMESLEIGQMFEVRTTTVRQYLSHYNTKTEKRFVSRRLGKDGNGRPIIGVWRVEPDVYEDEKQDI